MSLSNFSPDLTRPHDLDSLSRSLGIAIDLMELVISCDDPEKIYRQHRILKRSAYKGVVPKKHELAPGLIATEISLPTLDSYRIVWESMSPALKLAHKSACAAITAFLMNRVNGFPHANAYGYVRGRSTRDHAARHVGAQRIVSADIKNFFPSITLGRIEAALLNAGIHRNVAGKLARFLTINDVLPLGLNSSPVISSLVSHPLDSQFTAFADSRGITYTRYADDLTFSGKTQLPSAQEIAEILSANQFKLNESKYRSSKRGQRHYVTGLSVDDRQWPHVPRRIKKRLRQELHFIEKFGIREHLSKLEGVSATQHQVNRIDGLVNYVASIEPRLAHRLREQWNTICASEKIERSFEPRPFIKLRQAHWFVDEAEFTLSGKKMLAVCVVDLYQIGKTESAIAEFEASELGDAFADRKFRLHWADFNLSQREKGAKLLAPMPFRSIICFDELKPGEYKKKYCGLLCATLNSMMRSADDSAASIYIEANRSKVSIPEIEETIAFTYEDLKNQNRRRPVNSPDVLVLPKGSRPGLFVPDALLGAFSAYAQTEDGSNKVFNAKIFERLRPRYNLIADLHANAAYTLRRPFRVS